MKICGILKGKIKTRDIAFFFLFFLWYIDFFYYPSCDSQQFFFPSKPPVITSFHNRVSFSCQNIKVKKPQLSFYNTKI